MHEALIALGSNLGDSYAHLKQAKQAIGHLGEIRGYSSLYQTAPVGGPEGQPDFLNAVLALYTALTPQALLIALLEIETHQQRTREVRWGARTLDADLLSYAQHVMTTPTLTLPHPRMMTRAFVLIPLHEISPTWRHPVTGCSALEALSHVGRSGVVQLTLNW